MKYETLEYAAQPNFPHHADDDDGDDDVFACETSWYVDKILITFLFWCEIFRWVSFVVNTSREWNVFHVSRCYSLSLSLSTFRFSHQNCLNKDEIVLQNQMFCLMATPYFYNGANLQIVELTFVKLFKVSELLRLIIFHNRNIT